MSELITTLHPQDDNSVNLYPNVKLENIIDGKSEDAGKFVKVNEEGKFTVEAVDIPDPQQVNNSTITVKQGGVDKGSFTLNQAEDTTIELDAGGSGGSGSTIYATNKELVGGVPAYTEAANPIKVGDTINQLCFNTDQDIKYFLENNIDWSTYQNSMRIEDGISIYSLLSTLSDENSTGFRLIEKDDFIYGLKIKSDYTPGDGKIDAELNSWLQENFTGTTSLLTVKQADGNEYNALTVSVSGSNVYELNITTKYEGSSYRIYSSEAGFISNGFVSDTHSYTIVEDNNREAIISNLTYGDNWNGVFFGAVSNIGKPILSAVYLPADGYHVPNPTYVLVQSLYPLTILYSSEISSNLDIYTSGWLDIAKQPIIFETPGKAKVVNNIVSKITSTEENNWVSVPETLSNIYKDNILTTEEIKLEDILIDTSGKFGRVKELSEESIKNQHPENPYVDGETITPDAFIYIDTSIHPDLSKIAWSKQDMTLAGNLPIYALMMPAVGASYEFKVDLNYPVYYLVIANMQDGSGISGGMLTYLQADPIDVESLQNSSSFKDFGGEVNQWVIWGDIEHDGSVYKFPVAVSETATVTDIISQDVWGAFITKDGKWVEDALIIKTKVSCEYITHLPNDYSSIKDTPIIKLNKSLEDKDLILFNYVNKYIQDETGGIYYYNGENFYKLGESLNPHSINLYGQDNINVVEDRSEDYYKAYIGLSSDAKTKLDLIPALSSQENDTKYSIVREVSSSGINLSWQKIVTNIIGSNGVTAADAGLGSISVKLDDTLSSTKAFTASPGIITNSIDNTDGNRIYDYDSTNNRFGSIAKPTHIRGSEDRPKYESPDTSEGAAAGSTVLKNIAFTSDFVRETVTLDSTTSVDKISEIIGKHYSNEYAIVSIIATSEQFTPMNTQESKLSIPLHLSKYVPPSSTSEASWTLVGSAPLAPSSSNNNNISQETYTEDIYTVYKSPSKSSSLAIGVHERSYIKTTDSDSTSYSSKFEYKSNPTDSGDTITITYLKY